MIISNNNKKENNRYNSDNEIHKHDTDYNANNSIIFLICAVGLWVLRPLLALIMQ
jgi:hypothetical protein